MEMSNRYRLLSFLMSLLSLSSGLSHANEGNRVTIINHFDKSLSFIIGLNPDALPDLPEHFTLATNEQIQTNVMVGKKESYIRVEDDNNHTAYFGIETVNNEVKIHGYISKGIAFSWPGKIITFCTPEEYKKKHSC